MKIGVFEILPIKEKDFDFEVRLHLVVVLTCPQKSAVEIWKRLCKQSS